jgi:alpha-L-fucosidase 2
MQGSEVLEPMPRHTRATPLLALALALASAVPAAAARHENVQYATADGQSLVFDAYVPDGPGPHPAAILVHGGAWVAGDKTRSVRPLFEPLERAGIAWFSISYRLPRGSSRDVGSLLSLAGLTAVTGQIEDVRTAIRYVHSRAAEYSIDPGRIAIIGESAGAQLAAMAVLTPGASAARATPAAPPVTSPAVRAVVSFYGPNDLVALVQDNDAIPDRLRRAIADTPLQAMLTGSLQRLSPRHALHPAAPPFLLIHGTGDQLVPYQQSVDMCAAIEETGGSCELIRVDGAPHGVRRWTGAQNAYQSRMTLWLAETLDIPRSRVVESGPGS